MKNIFSIQFSVVLASSALLFTACGKNDTTSAPAPKSDGSAAASAANATATAAGEMKKQAEEIKGAAEAKVKETASQASSQAQALIDQAKSMISQNKYTEALSSLNQLGSFKLAPDQQQLVEKLKEQVQKAIAGQSVPTSVGNLIPGAK